MTPEAKVKDKIKKFLKANAIYYAMPATGGYGVSGVPDFLCCVKGKFVGIEAKLARARLRHCKIKTWVKSVNQVA
jgi:hypothetical protein